MTDIVLDASVAIPIVWREDVSALVRRNLDRWIGEGVSFVVPAHFWTEVVNSLTKRHGQTGSVVMEALFELDQLAISTAAVDRPLLVAGLDLVERTGLVIYDALYLALARAMNAKLATLDGALVAAGGRDVVDLSSSRGRRLSEELALYSTPQRPVTWPSWPGAGAYLGTLRRQAMAER